MKLLALVALVLVGMLPVVACSSAPPTPAQPSSATNTEQFTIPSLSMEPTLMKGDVVTLDTTALDDRAVRRGDLVVFEKPRFGVNEASPEPQYFEGKRVIGLSGETIRVTKEGVSVNGSRLDEPYLAPGGSGPTGKWIVKPGSVFVLGDNRAVSSDSRVYGSLPVTSIYGLVVNDGAAT